MESLYKRKMFASMRKTKVDASKKRQIGLPASILDDSDEGSFSSSSSSGSQSDFHSSPEDDSEQEDRDRSDSGATSSDDSRSVTRRKRSFLGGDDSSSSSSGEEEDDDDDDEEDRSQPKRTVQPRKRSRLQRQDESDSDHAEEKRREEAEKAKRRQRHNKLLALSRRMKARIPSRRRGRLKQGGSDEEESKEAEDEAGADEDGGGGENGSKKDASEGDDGGREEEKDKEEETEEEEGKKFPLARPDVCGKWVAAMRRNNFKPTKYSNICSQHFTKDCFKRECNNRVLKENAVPSLFTFNLSIKSESLEDPFPSDIHFPLSLPLTSELAAVEAEGETEEEPGRSLADSRGDTAAVSCDHNYTAEDSARQKKRIELLEEQLGSLRKKLKTTQQKCRRQERQLKRLKAACETARTVREPPPAFGEGYVILPKHIYHTLKGIE